MSRESNSKKITEAFAKATGRMDAAIIAGMSALLDAGMDYCLKHHDEVITVGGETKHYHYTSHERMRDSYGWLLMHDGVEVARRIKPATGLTDKDGREVTGHANELLNAVRTEVTGSGWVGIVLASVVPPSYFHLQSEFKMMRLATKDLKHEDFNKYFKSLAI